MTSRTAARNELRRVKSPNGWRHMTKSVTLRSAEAVYEEFREVAAAERRLLSKLVETAALARIREAQFVDDAEAAEILNDDALVCRMKTGSQEARWRGPPARPAGARATSLHEHRFLETEQFRRELRSIARAGHEGGVDHMRYGHPARNSRGMMVSGPSSRARLRRSRNGFSSRFSVACVGLCCG